MADNIPVRKRLAQQAGSYDSEFEFDSESDRKRRKYEDLAKKEKKKSMRKGQKQEVEDEYNKEEGRIMRHRIVSMNAFDRHKLLINNYLTYYYGKKTDFQRDRSKDKTDIDVIRENHRFLWTEEDDQDENWSKRLAKRYYDKLFKEYCIADLSRYKENKFAMRWRIEKEVQEGKGQFICGNKKCSECEDLRSWEVNFAYIEEGQKKNALVKLRLCSDCSYKLNFHHRKKEIKPSKGKDRVSETGRKQTRADIQNSDENHGRDEKERKTASNNEDPSGSTCAENIWSGPAKILEEKSREEEFDEYFADMFL